MLTYVSHSVEARGKVHDHQIRAGAQELVAATRALDEIGGHHGDRVSLEDGLRADESAFQAANRAGQHQFGFQAELAPEFSLPLLGQRGTAQHRQAAGVTDLEQFGGDQGGLDGLADTDVVGDQQAHDVLAQRHHQRHHLVGARFDRDRGQAAERACGGTESDPQRTSQQRCAQVVAEVLGARRRE